MTPEKVEKAKRLNEIAKLRGQSLPQLALAWILRQEQMTSVIIGASRLEQIEENVRALDHLEFTPEELAQIDSILNG